MIVNPVRKGVPWPLVAGLVATVLLSIFASVGAKFILPRSSSGPKTTSADATTGQAATVESEDKGGDSAGTSTSFDSTGGFDISTDRWDAYADNVEFTDATFEKDKYGRYVVHATAVNHADTDAIVRAEASIELSNMSNKFVKLKGGTEVGELLDGISAILKDDGNTPSIDVDTLRLAPHEKTRITAYVSINEDILTSYGETPDLIYGEDYQYFLSSFSPCALGSSADQSMAVGSDHRLHRSDIPEDKEELFFATLQDVTCEVISTDVVQTKQKDEYDFSTTIRVRNTSDESRAVGVYLGVFDNEGNFTPYGRVYLKDDTTLFSISKGNGASFWDREYMDNEYRYPFAFDNPLRLGGKLEAGTEIEITVEGILYVSDTEVSPETLVRIVGMTPITVDLATETGDSRLSGGEPLEGNNYTY